MDIKKIASCAFWVSLSWFLSGNSIKVTLFPLCSRSWSGKFAISNKCAYVFLIRFVSTFRANFEQVNMSCIQRRQAYSESIRFRKWTYGSARTIRGRGSEKVAYPYRRRRPWRRCWHSRQNPEKYQFCANVRRVTQYRHLIFSEAFGQSLLFWVS